MMPVEEGNTSRGLHPNACATALQVARAASKPAWPTAQLALPALIATARTFPPVARRCSWSTSRGAAFTRLAVNAAAALDGASATINAKSVRPLAFNPAFVAPKRKPFGIKNPDISLIGSRVCGEDFHRRGDWFQSFNLAGEGSMTETATAAPQIDEHQFLELEHVNVARGDRIVLHDVNLSIRAGEHVAILGPNGCGKSTLIFTITCQIYPIVQPDMRVRIFGRERWDLTQLRKHFGIVAAGPFGSELPGERTAVTTGLDAVIAGFFSASTLWPNLHVTQEMRERAVEAL